MKRMAILVILFSVSACATMRTPDGEQLPLFHPDYKSENHEELRRELNYKNIMTGKPSDTKMPGYHISEDDEPNSAWGTAYSK